MVSGRAHLDVQKHSLADDEKGRTCEPRDLRHGDSLKGTRRCVDALGWRYPSIDREETRMSLWDRLLSRFVPLVDGDVSRLDRLDGVSWLDERLDLAEETALRVPSRGGQ